MKPAVSVVTPCHNAMRFVGTMIDSVIEQSFGAWELIVIDDGSTDGSAEIVRDRVARDSRVQLVSQSNAGVHEARQHGAKIASEAAEFVMFLDADDQLHPDYLSTMVAYMQARPDVGLAYCAHDRIDETGSPSGFESEFDDRFVSNGLRVRRLATDEPETPLESLVSRFEAIPSTAVLRRSVFDRTRGWRNTGVVEDKDMVMQMALLAPVHFVPRHLSYHRQHDANRSATNFYESMKSLHTMWWSDETLSQADRRDVRAAIAFDQRVSAHMARESAVAELRRGRPRAAALELGRALKRHGHWVNLSARSRW